MNFLALLWKLFLRWKFPNSKLYPVYVTCVVNIFCLDPFFVHFDVVVYVLKTVEESIQSGTEALGGLVAGLALAKVKTKELHS